MNLPKVALVGRTNVGKSTLFNRLTESNKALVSDIAGTTRDRNIAQCLWTGLTFILIDTGGLDVSYLSATHTAKDLLKKKTTMAEIEKSIIKQTQIAVSQADLILFIIDADLGIMPEDRSVLHYLRKHEKPFILVANKADNDLIRSQVDKLKSLGAGTPMLVSGSNGVGCGDLLDEVIKKIKNIEYSEPEPEIRVAIVGKPNVGKSSLLNILCGEERVIVSAIAHTTRESHDTLINYKEKNIRLIDTAGIRKQSKLNQALIKRGVVKSVDTIHQADIILFVFSINEPLTAQDHKILQEILDTRASLIFVANKWDLIEEKTTRSQNEYRKNFEGYVPYIRWAPMIFLSAKTGKGAKKIFDVILEVFDSRFLQVDEADLEVFTKKLVEWHKPKTSSSKKPGKIFRIEQVEVNPPRFVIYVNDKKLMPPSYIRYAQNQLYERYKFLGSPIVIEFRKKI